MYTESEFMDMSLASRLDKLNSEITKLVDEYITSLLSHMVGSLRVFQLFNLKLF